MCVPPARREPLIERGLDAMRPAPGSKQRSLDVGCGFVQFCHKHIFASPAAVSPAARKMSQSRATAVSSQSQLDSFNSHFNPCYSNSSPPDDDDDINLDALNFCDSLCSSRARKTRGLPVVSEMSESCFEGLQSSSDKPVMDLPRMFRPLSWAGHVDDCLTGSACSCYNQSVVPAAKSEKWNASDEYILNPISEAGSDEQFTPLSGEAPFYWELELPNVSSDTNLTSLSTLPETCQRLASPLRMGTLAFDTGNVPDSGHSHAAAKKLLPNKPLCQNLSSVVDTVKAPKMGCLICRNCQHICSACAVDGRAVLNTVSLPSEVPQACKCMRRRRCPTPPRMLSPGAGCDDSIRVPVADV